jgi:hypothetical protein
MRDPSILPSLPPSARPGRTTVWALIYSRTSLVRLLSARLRHIANRGAQPRRNMLIADGRCSGRRPMALSSTDVALMEPHPQSTGSVSLRINDVEQTSVCRQSVVNRYRAPGQWEPSVPSPWLINAETNIVLDIVQACISVQEIYQFPGSGCSLYHV